MPTNPYRNTDQVKAVIKVRRGPEVDRSQVTYEDGELVYSTDKKRLFVGDGVGDEGTDGGNLVGNKIWVSDSFNSANLPYIQKYDLVYRPNTTGFYILTGDSILDPKSYILVGGKELLPQVATFTLPKATNSTLGGVIVKTGLMVDANGNLNIDYDPNAFKLVGNKLSIIPGAGGGGTGTIGNASYAAYGKIRVVENTGLIVNSGDLSVNIDNKTIKLSSVAGGDKLYVDSSELEITNLPIATTTDLGAIIVSDGLQINSSTGQLSLKTATNNFIGGVKTGSGLSANSLTSELDVLVDSKTIQINGATNQLEVNYPVANNGDVLTYNGSTNTWVASAARTSRSGKEVYAWVKFSENIEDGIFDIVGYNVSIITKPTNTGREIHFTTPITSEYIVIANAKHNDTALNVFGSNYAAEGVSNDQNSCYVNYYGPPARGSIANPKFFRFNVVIIA
jgi:hypothetical protein